MLVVDFADRVGEACSASTLRLERHAHANNFERVREEDARHARQAAAHEAPDGRLVRFVGYHSRADLLVCEEFDAAVGEDPQQRR